MLKWLNLVLERFKSFLLYGKYFVNRFLNYFLMNFYNFQQFLHIINVALTIEKRLLKIKFIIKESNICYGNVLSVT